MQIELQQRGKYLLVQAKGRLDVSWADYFTDTLLLQIRNGRHDILIDGSELIFLSSAGIRALLLVHKELKTVSGRFSIANPTAFVEQTLSTSGFQMWLRKGFPEDMPAAIYGNEGETLENSGIQRFTLNENAQLKISETADWRPWQVIEKSRVKTLTFSLNDMAFGIGSPAGTFEDARNQFGEFLAVAGNVVFQPPDEQGPPDYLIAEKDYIPRMQCAQVVNCTGGLKYLIRFAPTERTPFYSISGLLRNILDQPGTEVAGFVMLGEIDGLVGTALIRSPGQITEEREIAFPEIRDWLTFCSERSYSHQQALLAGVVSRTSRLLLPALPSASDLSGHIHAAVFPYQPLQNGKIELETAVRKFFTGPPPLAVMHLADDIRPVAGLGESALIRGACWFGPLQNPEVLS